MKPAVFWRILITLLGVRGRFQILFSVLIFFSDDNFFCFPAFVSVDFQDYTLKCLKLLLFRRNNWFNMFTSTSLE